MKYRTSFVTNSSSNCYIVAWKNKPDSVKAILDMLEYDSDTEIGEAEWSKTNGLEVAEFLFSMTKKHNQIKEAKDFSVWFSRREPPNLWQIEDSLRYKYWEMESFLNRAYSDEFLSVWIKKNKNSHIRYYEFSDSGSHAEISCHNGDTFTNVDSLMSGNH